VLRFVSSAGSTIISKECACVMPFGYISCTTIGHLVLFCFFAIFDVSLRQRGCVDPLQEDHADGPIAGYKLVDFLQQHAAEYTSVSSQYTVSSDLLHVNEHTQIPVALQEDALQERKLIL